MNTVGWILLGAGVLGVVVLGQVLAAVLDRTRARRVVRDLPERTEQSEGGVPPRR